MESCYFMAIIDVPPAKEWVKCSLVIHTFTENASLARSLACGNAGLVLLVKVRVHTAALAPWLGEVHDRHEAALAAPWLHGRRFWS